MYFEKKQLRKQPFTHRFFVGLFLGVAVGLSIGAVMSVRDRWVAEVSSPSNMMALQGEKQFVEYITCEKVVVVDFHARWCAPCHTLTPWIRQIAEVYSNRIKVLTVDVEENPGTVRLFGVHSVPDVRFYKNGVLKKAIVGLEPKAVYTDILDRLLAGDEVTGE